MLTISSNVSMKFKVQWALIYNEAASDEYSASRLSAIETSAGQPDISSLWVTEAAFSPYW